MRLKFTEDYTPKAAGAKPYKKDQVVEFKDDAAGTASANHFMNRGVAVNMDADRDKEDEAADKPRANAPTPKKMDGPQGLVPNAPQKG